MITSILFPAFVNEYSGTEGQVIGLFDNSFKHYLESASYILKLDLTEFDFTNNNFLQDEFKSQCISYLYSCSVADILKKQNVMPAFVTGYSMGIYAALYYCGAVVFKDGLLILKNAWNIISEATNEGSYGMGMIIGLSQSDVLQFLSSGREVEICNQNNQHTFIISGPLTAVESVLDEAKNEGALRTGLLPVSKPYHSQFLEKTTPEFTSIIDGLSFQTPTHKYISCLDQRIIETVQDLKQEVIKNLSNRMNWLATMNYLVTMGTGRFFECGAGDGLTRNLRFIDGDFKSFSIGKLEKFLDSGKMEQ